MDLTHLPRCSKEGGGSRLLDAGVAIGDDPLNTLQSSLFEVFKGARPECFILAIRDLGSQDLPVTVFTDAGNRQERLAEVPGSFPDLVVGSIQVWIRYCLLNRSLKEFPELNVEIFGHPGNRGRREILDPEMSNNLLNFPG